MREANEAGERSSLSHLPNDERSAERQTYLPADVIYFLISPLLRLNQRRDGEEKRKKGEEGKERGEKRVNSCLRWCSAGTGTGTRSPDVS